MEPQPSEPFVTPYADEANKARNALLREKAQLRFSRNADDPAVLRAQELARRKKGKRLVVIILAIDANGDCFQASAVEKPCPPSKKKKKEPQT